MKLTKEIKIALVAVVGILIMYFGINFLKGINLFSANNAYYMTFDKSGAWATTHDGQRINGMAKVREYYEEHSDLFEELKNIVKSKLSGVELEAEYTVDPNTGEIIE